jgi:pimeloyl-ACP methyl ester carboxylesterase
VTNPIDELGLLAMQEVAVTRRLRHVEGFTRSGLLTLLWHGEGDEEKIVLASGGAMGGLLGPAGGLFHDLGVAMAERGIGFVRVGYRRPNDLDACVYDVAAAGQIAAGYGAERAVTMGHSFGGAVAVRVGVAMPEFVVGVVTFATQSAGCEVAEGLAGRPVLLFHGDRDELLPPQCSELVQMLAGGELVMLPGTGHLMTEGADVMRERLLDWLPEVLG